MSRADELSGLEQKLAERGYEVRAAGLIVSRNANNRFHFVSKSVI